jgi:hypothetical protein
MLLIKWATCFKNNDFYFDNGTGKFYIISTSGATASDF